MPIMSTDAAFSSTVDQVELPADRALLEQLVRQLLAREAEHAARETEQQMREAQLVAALNESTQTVNQQQELLDGTELQAQVVGELVDAIAVYPVVIVTSRQVGSQHGHDRQLQFGGAGIAGSMT